MKKRLILIFVILIVLIFIVSGCEQIKGRNVNRNIADNENAQPIFVCNNNEKRCSTGNECNGSPCVMSCQNNQWIESEYCLDSCSEARCITNNIQPDNNNIQPDNFVNGLINKNNKDFFKPQIRNKFSIDNENFLLVNNQRVFTNGSYINEPEGVSGFNSLLVLDRNYGGPFDFDASKVPYTYRDFQNIMNANNKILFVFSKEAWQGEGSRELYNYDALEGVFNYLNSCTFVNPFVNVAGYQNRDEPIWSGYSFEKFSNAYYKLKEADPNGLVWTNFAAAHPSDDINQWRDDIWQYSSTSDIISADIYVVPNNPCGPEDERDYPYCVFENNQISVIGDVVDELIESVRNEKPVWIVLQATGVISYEKSRFMAYQAIVHGVTGIFYFGHHLEEGLDENTLNSISDLSRFEFNDPEFKQVLITDTTKQEINTEIGIEYIIKRYNNGQNLTDSLADYIIAVNRNNNQVSKEFEINTDVERVKVLFENRYIELNNGNFEDMFNPFDVHVYRVPIINQIRGTPAKILER